MSKTVQEFLSQRNSINRENPISIGKGGLELQVIKEIHISRHMTIFGQNVGRFKHENNECIRNGGKTKLHKIKIVGFFDLACVVL